MVWLHLVLVVYSEQVVISDFAGSYATREECVAASASVRGSWCFKEPEAMPIVGAICTPQLSPHRAVLPPCFSRDAFQALIRHRAPRD